MNIVLNWSPGAGATSQVVRYKLSTVSATPDSNWTVHSTVSGSTNTVTINGLSDNLIYDFQIVTNCSGGTASPSTTTQQINIICPTVTVTATNTTISYSFPAVGGSTTGYTVKLYNSAGTSELSSQTPAGTTTLTGTFSNPEGGPIIIAAGTAYKIRVIVTAGAFSKTDCAFVDITTSTTPSCNAPTDLTATLA